MTCPDAFNCLNLEVKNGKVKMSACCAMHAWEVEKIDFFNDPTLVKIRQQWNNKQWPEECSFCRKSEELGNNSRRKGSIQWAIDHLGIRHDQFNEVKLIKLDYYAGNTCNLRCAICGPNDSIAWQKELGIAKNERVVDQNLIDINTDDIAWIHFTGGEPLLIDEHWNVLKSVKQKENVVLNYNTNGTTLPKQELIDLWSQFKYVMIDFSIDDIGNRFEYQRYPAKWENVVENLFWFRENMPVNVMFAINTSLGLLNHSNYDNLKKWFNENFSTNRVKDRVYLRWQPTVGILSKDVEDKRRVRKYLNDLDSRRGTRWKETFPELVDFLLK